MYAYVHTHTYTHIYICLLTCLWHYQRKQGVRKELRSSLSFAMLLEDLKMVEKRESSVTKSLRIHLPSKWTQLPTLSLPQRYCPFPILISNTTLETWSLSFSFSCCLPTSNVASSSSEFISTSLQKSCCLSVSTALLTEWAQFGFSLCFLILHTTSRMVIEPLFLRCLWQVSITYWVKPQCPIGSSSRLDIKCSPAFSSLTSHRSTLGFLPKESVLGKARQTKCEVNSALHSLHECSEPQIPYPGNGK